MKEYLTQSFFKFSRHKNIKLYLIKLYIIQNFEFSKNIHSLKETSTSRHEEVQRRREASLAKKREKILADVEKTDQKAREARRRNRWSWGGNVTGENFS